MQRRAIIARSDLDVLIQLLASPRTRWLADESVIATLSRRLQESLHVDDCDLPSTIVSMRSIVLLSDTASGEVEEFTLVYPDEADILHGKLTVLAPIGLSVLGSRIGQTLRVPVPSGERSLHIEDILYQPQHLSYGRSLPQSF